MSTRLYAALLAGLLTGTALTPFSACAQEAASDADVFEGYTALDPITVFATLSPIRSFDYPGMVTVVERGRIEDLQASSVADLFEGVPGVQVDGGPRRTGLSPTIRGIREEDVLILVDGARQSFISGHDGRIFIEPDLLKAAEIVRGPISALYGSGALGGVIALTTVDASDFLAEGETTGVRLKAGYQSVNDEFVVTSTGFARSVDGKADTVASFTFRESGDIELGDGSTLPAEDSIRAGLLKGTFEVAPELKVMLSWVFYRDDALDPQNPQGANVAAGDNPLVDRTVKSDTWTGRISYAPTGNPFIDGNLTLYMSRHEVEEDEIVIDRLTTREVETMGLNIDNRSRFSIMDWGKLTLTYGAEYYEDEQTGFDSATPNNARGGVPNASATFAGAFAQAELKMNGALGELTLLPGVRFDRFTNEASGQDAFSDQAVSPKFGASYKPLPWLLFFSNYGEAFRAPSFNELYASGRHFNIGRAVNNFIPNPDLGPQDGSTVEFGGGLDFTDLVLKGDKLTLKGSYWQSDVNDFIDLQVNGLSGPAPGCFIPPFTGCTSQFVNIANAELDGVEIELLYDSSRIYGRLAYSTIDGRDRETGEFLGVLQPDKLYVDAGVKVPEIWARFGARATFAQDFDKVNDPAEKRDGYTTLDVYAVFEAPEGMLKGLRLDLGVDNLTDEDYEVIAAGVSEPGVDFKGAISWTYKW